MLVSFAIFKRFKKLNNIRIITVRDKYRLRVKKQVQVDYESVGRLLETLLSHILVN